MKSGLGPVVRTGKKASVKATVRVDTAYQESIKALWAGVPDGRFVGNTSVFPHQQVLFIASIIDSAGIAILIDKWQAEDAVATVKGPGGRPRTATVTTRTALILLLLLTVEHSSQLVDEMAVVAMSRLSPESAAYLGLDGAMADVNGERRSKSQWYSPIYRSLRRALGTIDPKPHTSTKRGKFPTNKEVDEMKERWTADELGVKQRRLERVNNDLLQATIDMVPEEYAKFWEGDTCIDATVVPAYGKRGAPFGGTHGPNDPSAGWYRRDHDHNVVEEGSKKSIKKAVFGWDLTIVVQTNHEPDEIASFPKLITGIGMTVPATNLIRTATDIYTDISRRQLKVGRVVGDRGYGASAKAADFQLPVRALGHTMVMDYKTEQLGRGSGEEYAGAMQVEGAWYCPSMREDLVNATILLRAGEIDAHTWRLRIAERRNYMLRAKEKPDAKGSVAMMCPARGPGATARCPLAEGCSTTELSDGAVTIENYPDENSRGAICTNKTSVTIPATAGAKQAQDLQYGSERWSREYAVDRNGIEGTNAYAKDGAKEDLENAARRRLRGYAAQFLLITFTVATANLRRIQSFRDKQLLAKSAADQEVRIERQKARREKRRSREDRIAPWGEFSLAEPDDKDAAPVKPKRTRTPKRVVPPPLTT
ncbi:hypothetical protein ABIE21_003296 [Conyzicola nivalis]|uniref:Transposase n=1 Tax=Conyzicola nivalis TaxID=1477021 RepID=A0ABV2QS49_9MICO